MFFLPKFPSLIFIFLVATIVGRPKTVGERFYHKRGSFSLDEDENYRIEAEHLFNIGANLGVTSNDDEIIVMIDRLIDLEEQEAAENVAMGDVDVDR
jgi:hypothetical protein